MKKTVFVLFLIAFFFHQSFYSFAEDKSSGMEITSPAWQNEIINLADHLEAAVSRVNNIKERLEQRLKKIQKDGEKALILNNQFSLLAKSADKLVEGHAKIQSLAKVFLKSPQPNKDYRAFRSQIKTFDDYLNNAYSAEKDLLKEMQKIETATTSAYDRSR